MKVTMIGMGAVGAVVGKRLNEFLGKENLECIADGSRLERYRNSGILINGERIDFNYVTPQEAQIADLVIIATKNLQLKEVLVQIEKSVGPNTAILSLLNGIQSEREIAEKYGAEKTLYGYIVSLSSTNEGGMITCGHEGTIYFGENDNSKSERILEIKKLFDDAKISSVIPEDIHLSQWKKFLLNVSCNTISALCRQTYKGFRNEVTQNLVRQCAREVVKIANAKGIALTEEMIEDNIRMTAALNDDGKTSMFQDVEAKRKTENNYFCGTIVRLGKELGIETPVCTLLQQLVECVEAAF
ncbi:ketopantoate reductase family protein [Treponema sp.]|uniref:ketopantoate reductase family protein n=1 Tax=Treponema sp. TaxID=166 RepID=UPI00298E1B3E|nr:ketopantoate reductase family protein [Treponema sp.]MCQ2241001.1 ketopantoate reductase family protein [Treponema sp.]